MNTRQISIVLISNDKERLQTYSDLLAADTGNKIKTGTFEIAFQQIFIEENPDLLILDTTSYANFDYRIVEPLRSQVKYKNLPFIFIISSDKTSLVQQLYKDPHNRILTEPVNKYMLISEINNSVHLNELEHKVGLYKDIIDGEKQLISYMDELLELNRMTEFKTKKSLLDFVQSRFVKRLELALAVEMCFIGVFNEEKQSLEIKLFSEDVKQVIREISLSVKNSKIAVLIKNNYPNIFENELLLDPFIQELEELLGFKITGLLFTPMILLHKPLAAIILVNKLYRTEFSENDLAFATISAQKVVYQFEKLEMLNVASNHLLLKKSSKKDMAPKDLMLEKVLSSVDFGLIIFDEDLNLFYNNAASNAILRKVGPTNNLKDLFDKKTFEEIQKSYLKGDFPVSRQEIRLSVENETEFYIVFSIYAMGDAENNPYFALVFNEISQSKRIQAEIIRMDRMASLGILSSGIAHEIRNPLAGIKAMVQNMEEENPKNSNTLEYTVRILRQVDRLDNLLKSFFSYAKPMRPDPKECHLKNIVEDSLSLFITNFREKSIKVDLNLAEDLSKVFVDANQIQQVLINIILNSIQAMENRGVIKISAVNAQKKAPALDRRKRVPGLLSDQYIEITISDTGSGFDENLKDKIFDPFFTTKASGTGLGLAIVYQIIREHGGQIDVESVVNEGTTFKILLPASVEKELVH
jgi:signal transduction histidine kinase/CheY-like chemotaxis protein